MSFPTNLDSFVTPDNTKYQDDPAYTESAIIWALNTAVTRLETKVGIDWSADTSSLDYKTSRLTTKGDILTHDWTNPIRQPAWTNWHMLVVDNTSATWLNYIAPTSWGTVTSSAFTNWNGVNWVVSNPTTTPTLALSFPNSWLQKSNGTALSSATAWTDYSVPTGVETLTNKTLTSPTITTPIINIGSDANGDTYYRNAGTTKRLGIGSENQFYTSDWAIPQWNNPFTYTGTVINDTVSATWAWNTYTTTSRQTNNMTIANVALSWLAGSSYFEYSPDNSSWTTIVTTTWASSFPILLRKWYYYRVVASATVNWPTSTATINYMQ